MKYICVVLNTKEVTMKTIEELRQGSIYLTMSIEDEENLSKLVVYGRQLFKEIKTNNRTNR